MGPLACIALVEDRHFPSHHQTHSSLSGHWPRIALDRVLDLWCRAWDKSRTHSLDIKNSFPFSPTSGLFDFLLSTLLIDVAAEAHLPGTRQGVASSTNRR